MSKRYSLNKEIMKTWGFVFNESSDLWELNVNTTQSGSMVLTTPQKRNICFVDDRVLQMESPRTLHNLLDKNLTTPNRGERSRV